MALAMAVNSRVLRHSTVQIWFASVVDIEMYQVTTSALWEN